MTDSISTIGHHDGARAGTLSLDGNLLSEGRQEAASETLNALKLLYPPDRVELKLWNVVHNRKERSQHKFCKQGFGRHSEVKMRGFGGYCHRLQAAGWPMSYADFINYVLAAIPRTRKLVNPTSRPSDQLSTEKQEQSLYLDDVERVFRGQGVGKNLGKAVRTARASAHRKDANELASAAAAHPIPTGQPYATHVTTAQADVDAPLLAFALANGTSSRHYGMHLMQQGGGNIAPTAVLGHRYSHHSITGPPPTALGPTEDPESIDVFENVLQTLREFDEIKRQQAAWGDAAVGRGDAQEANATADEAAMLRPLLSTMTPAHAVDPGYSAISTGAPSHQDLARMLPLGAPSMMTAPCGYDYGPGMMAPPSALASSAGLPIVSFVHCQGPQGNDIRRQGQLDWASGSSSDTMAAPTNVNASPAPRLYSAAEALGPASQSRLGDAAETQPEGEQTPTLQPSIGGVSASAQEVVHASLSEPVVDQPHSLTRAPQNVIQPGIALHTATDPILLDLARRASHDPRALVSEYLRRIDRAALNTSDGLLPGLPAQLVNVNSLMGAADDPLAPLAALCIFFSAVADVVRATSLVYVQAFGSVTQQLPPSAYATPAISTLANIILSARRHCIVMQSAPSAGMGPTSVSSAATQVPSMTSSDTDTASASSAEVHGRFLTGSAEDTSGPHRPDETAPSHAEPDERAEMQDDDTWAADEAQLEVAEAASDAQEPMHPRPMVSPPPSPKRPRQPSPAHPHGPPRTTQSDNRSETFAVPAPGASEEIFPDDYPMRIPL